MRRIMMEVQALLLAALLMPAAIAQPAAIERLMAAAVPPDAEAILRWESATRQVLATATIERGDTEGLAAKVDMLKLLDAPRQSIEGTRQFSRACRVRSLQAVSYGVFAYQFFPCRFRLEDGLVVFEKNSGSQRRAGLAALDEDGSLAFLGASYYSDEKPRRYSGLIRGATPEDRERDSIGRIYQIGEGRFLMGFAPIEGRAEIYEIRF